MAFAQPDKKQEEQALSAPLCFTPEQFSPDQTSQRDNTTANLWD
jgi:hypothetical protein